MPDTSDAKLILQALLERPAPTHDLPALRQLAAEHAHAIELRDGLAELVGAGLEPHYEAVDVTDAGAVARAVDRARAAFGPVTRLLHAAGVIADKRIEDKTVDQLERVFRTKVHGFASLLAATRDDPLEVVCALSSIAAMHGSAGQVDYAMANEVMGQHARLEAQRRPAASVHALALGPVAGGMMSPALQALYRDRGVPLLAVATTARTIAGILLGDGPEAVELALVPTAALP